MGLRYASVRQPHVLIMAPALTETGKPQGLPLNTDSLSLITLNEINLDNVKCAKRVQFVNTDSGMNGDSETQLKSLPDLIKIACNDNQTDKGVLNKHSNSKVQVGGISKESDYSLLQIGGYMMNNSYSTGDSEENMGLERSGSDKSTADSSNYLKIDILKSLGSTVPIQSDLAGGGDIGNNVDEIMQVLKNMESKSNDIEENLDSSIQMNESNDIAGSLSTFERELFNDVDMINSICVDENLGNLGLLSKDTVLKEKIDNTYDRQFKLERKCEWLVRRLQKMQAKSMGKHCGKELSNFLRHICSIMFDDGATSSKSPLYSALTSAKREADQEKKEPSNNSSEFVKRLEQSSRQQAVLASHVNVPCKYFGSGGRPSTSSAQGQPSLGSDLRENLKNVSEQLSFQLKVVEAGIDSDVTASSSGGESCDELQSFNNPQQQQLLISKRASWLWAQERAKVASRWAWLTAQISDLEYRIRQTNDIGKQLRSAKGGVVLGGEDPPRLGVDSVVVNGYHGPVVPGTDKSSSDDNLATNSVCRTRPLVRSSFRKRKLLPNARLHLTNKKVAKPVTVRCNCQPPLPGCVLCWGEPPISPATDLRAVRERIALVDPAFHPVLTFHTDVSQNVHFDAIMKTNDWQAKAHRVQLKTPVQQMRSFDHRSEDSDEALPHPAVEHQRRRYVRRSQPAAHLSDRSGDPGDSCEADDQMESSDRTGASYVVTSGVTRPSPISSPSVCAKDRGSEMYRRKRENSYDIDNIVIPYSVAASTRLEKLQYKEILTPKWRVLPVEPKIENKNNGLIRRLSEDEEEEDLTEDSFLNRHEKCEQEERKKFTSYLRLPNSMSRPRGHRRADSRAESSGGNTPDPMSPADDMGSPAISPPATPQPEEGHLRRRTVSSSRCVSPVDHDEVAPYELRTFPLANDAYEKMLKEMPPGHPYNTYSSSHHIPPQDSDFEGESRPVTPMSDSTESADTFVDEDPNDPEWTVDESSVDGAKR